MAPFRTAGTAATSEATSVRTAFAPARSIRGPRAGGGRRDPDRGRVLGRAGRTAGARRAGWAGPDDRIQTAGARDPGTRHRDRYEHSGAGLREPGAGQDPGRTDRGVLA